MVGHEEWFAPGGGKDDIDGFISPRGARIISALLTDQRMRHVAGNIAEIGTFFGKTFIGLAMAAKTGETVLGLDIYPDDMQRTLSGSLAARLSDDIDFFPRLVKADSTKTTRQAWKDLLQGQPTRFVHVDGDHNRDAVISDIRLAGSFLAEDAIVLIDDFLHDWYPDVTEGVFEALRQTRSLKPVAVIPRSGRLIEGGSKLLCATPSSAGHYGSLVKATFPELRTRDLRIAGQPAIALINED